MAKKQTRRSISVRGVTYERLRNYVAAASIGGGLSMSDFVEQRIAEWFAANPEAARAANAPAVQHRVVAAAQKMAPPVARARAAALAVHPVRHIDPATVKVRPGSDDRAKSRPAPAAAQVLPRDQRGHEAWPSVRR